jgi:hypothetical protein
MKMVVSRNSKSSHCGSKLSFAPARHVLIYKHHVWRFERLLLIGPFEFCHRLDAIQPREWIGDAGFLEGALHRAGAAVVVSGQQNATRPDGRV